MTLVFGFLIGTIVVRSKLPSFIVTLGFLFSIRRLMAGGTELSDLAQELVL